MERSFGVNIKRTDSHKMAEKYEKKMDKLKQEEKKRQQAEQEADAERKRFEEEKKQWEMEFERAQGVMPEMNLLQIANIQKEGL